MIETFHLNSRGANKKTPEEITKLFVDSTSEVISAIIDRYYADFRVCGYDDTLQLLRDILKSGS